MHDLTLTGVLDAIEDTLYIVDHKWRLVVINNHARRNWGLEEHDPLGRDLSSVRPGNTDDLRRRLHDALTEQRPSRFTWHSPTTRTWTSITVHPHQGGLIIQERDISDHKHAELALQASHQRLTLALEAAGMGMWDEDLVHGEVVWVGPMRQLLGLPEDTPPSEEAFLRHVHPEDRQALHAAYEHALHGGEYNEEFRVVRPDGQVRWLHTIGQITFENGRPVRSMGVDYDITDRKQLEQHLRTLNAQLEERVQERTAALDAHATSLQAANQELEAFSYSVSHDLRTPLRHISGFTNLLQTHLAGTLDDRAAHYLQAVESAAKRMNVLIDAMLEFSRMSREPMRVEPVDLEALVKRVRTDLEPEHAGRDVEWHVRPLPVVPGDREALQGALMNLLSNALKYTRTRNVTRVDVWAEEHPTEWEVFVRDNGVGFDPRYANKLFAVFQRLHRQDEFEGIGIGLAGVRRVIERHGGHVRAQSQPGEGATFSFTLPRQTHHS